MKEFTNQESLQEILKNDYFQESMMIEFLFNPQTSEFVWIGTRLNWELAAGHREFIKLLFKNVSHFQRFFPEFPDNRFRDEEYTFISKQHSGTYESENSIISNESDKSTHIQINLPYLLGRINFSFEQVILKRIIGVGKKLNASEWQYVDTETGQKFDFYLPFHQSD